MLHLQAQRGRVNESVNKRCNVQNGGKNARSISLKNGRKRTPVIRGEKTRLLLQQAGEKYR